jgi:hexosaminidase
MSWRGTKGGIEATHLGAKVVMSPSPMAYLDLYQGDFSIEPPTYGNNRLSITYGLNPLPEGIDEALVMGGQGNIWTEHLPAKAPLEYMAWPRGFAVAETYWSPATAKEWTGFVARVEHQFARFDAAERNYSTALYDPVIEVSRNEAGLLVIKLSTEVEGLQVHYTLDNTLPNIHYQPYTSPIEVPGSVSLFRVAAFREGRQVSKLLSIPITDLEKRLPRKN